MSVLFLGLDCAGGGTSASTSKKYHQNSNSSTHHYQHTYTRVTLPLYWCGWVNKNLHHTKTTTPVLSSAVLY